MGFRLRPNPGTIPQKNPLDGCKTRLSLGDAKLVSLEMSVESLTFSLAMPWRSRKPRRAAPRKSVYLGVVWSGGRWLAEVKTGRETVFLGRFSEEVAAARQYDRGARLLIGPTAETNESLGLL
jgi:hypothetical protein